MVDTIQSLRESVSAKLKKITCGVAATEDDDKYNECIKQLMQLNSELDSFTVADSDKDDDKKRKLKEFDTRLTTFATAQGIKLS